MNLFLVASHFDYHTVYTGEKTETECLKNVNFVKCDINKVNFVKNKILKL